MLMIKANDQKLSRTSELLRLSRILLSISACCLISGCTFKDGYELLHNIEQNRAECEQYITYDDYMACVHQFDQPYAEYQREVEDLLKPEAIPPE